MQLEKFIKVTDKEYHEHPAIGSHKFMQLLRSRRHMDTYAPKETPAMRFGRLVHKAVLEPEDFLLHLKIIPECDKRTKAGKELYEAFINTTQDTDLLVTPSELETFQKMIESTQKKESFKQIMEQPGCLFEHAAFFKNEGNLELELENLATKIKPDVVNPEHKYLIDLKTCQNAKEFKRDIFRYGYHFQAAFYSFHANMIVDSPVDFYFIALEKEAPYELIVYKLSDEILSIGYELLTLAKYEYAMNISQKGYEDTIKEITIAGTQKSEGSSNWNFEPEAVW